MNSEIKERRELTAKEKELIKYSVEHFCPKYQYQHDIDWKTMRWRCTAFDCDCIMQTKEWTGCYCSRFEKTILPQMPELQRLLEERYKQCAVCESYFAPHGRANTCSEKCHDEREREMSKLRQRKKRDKNG